jgi:hypothetical protein
VRLCVYASRVEYIWFVELSFGGDGQLQRCRVSPRFPSAGQAVVDNVLCSLAGMSSCDSLADLLDPAPSTGFVLLSRYVDQLATIHHLPLAPLQLRTADGHIVDLAAAQILAQGQHSLVLLAAPASSSVIKISLRSLIEHERRVHAVVDGCSRHLRRMVAGSSGHGDVIGVGDGLAFIVLDGFGVPLREADVSSPATLASLWEQAAAGLAAMHQKRTLHRDVKPSNMILLGGALLLNDFDTACSMDDDAAVRQLTVGTSDYHSPKLAGKWRERDDWLGLVLSFLSLRMPFPFANKQAALEQALQLDWVPALMKACITKSFK